MVRKCICASSIILKNGRVLVLWHRKLGVWLYPGGHVEEGEMPHEAAIRETLEETGFRIRITDPSGSKRMFRNKEAYELPVPFMVLYEHVTYKTGRHEHFDMAYLARINGRPRSKTEGAALRWVSKSEIGSLKTYGNVKWVLRRVLEHG